MADEPAGRPYALTDLTSGQICIRLSGEGARDVLAKGSTLDFHPRVFRVGQCAQTVLGKASMLIARLGASTGIFDIVVRRSYAEYAAQWLYRAAEEYGVRVVCRRYLPAPR